MRLLLRTAPANTANQQEGPAARPFVTPEIAALQRCRWRLPNDKAVRLLGYDPPVTFAEGCRRSLDWLLAQHQAGT
jgi:hypothetical protein